jgi:3-hydroxyisobutyrate dehydrogenase-like beta-hydroxyacid dehydrogenase
MSDVSVIGTGAMGSALVEALAASSAEVTVWNRTMDKAQALAGPSVGVAASPVEALKASPLTIVSVTDHDVARTLVHDAAEALHGKVVASTSFVTPDQARAFHAVVRAASGHYLDLSIPAYPSEVRSRAGVFLVSGDRIVYEAHRHRFERLGRATYIDEAPGAAYISEMAILLAYLPMAVGLLQGLRVCAQHDIPASWFNETVPEFYSFHIRSLLDRVAEQPDPATRQVEASVNEWGKTAAEYADYLREVGLDATMYDALHRMFAAAAEAGHGTVDWTGIAEHARVPSREPIGHVDADRGT